MNSNRIIFSWNNSPACEWTRLYLQAQKRQVFQHSTAVKVVYKILCLLNILSNFNTIIIVISRTLYWFIGSAKYLHRIARVRSEKFYGISRMDIRHTNVSYASKTKK